MEQNWRSPTGGASCWQSPRYRPNRSFGYGQQHEAGRFQSPPYSRSPNFHRSPRYARGYTSFNSSYSSSPISQQQQQYHHSFHRPQQQYRQFSPRGYFNQSDGPSRNKDSIENWVHPEMWGDPWEGLIKKSQNDLTSSEHQQQNDDNIPSARLAEVVMTDSDIVQTNPDTSSTEEPMSLTTNEDGDVNGELPSEMIMTDNQNSQVEENPNSMKVETTTTDPLSQSSLTSYDAVPLQ